MSTGATDGKYLRIAGIPTYGIACMFSIWKTTAPTAKTSGRRPGFLTTESNSATAS